MFQNLTDLQFPLITTVSNKGLLPHCRLGLILLLLVAIVGCPVVLSAQSKQELERRRKKLINDIAQTDKMLKRTTRSKVATFDRFVLLQKQIERREKLIKTINAEIDEAESAIARTADVIESLELDIRKMRSDYGIIVRNAYRRKTLSNPLLYILSADDLNQAFRRWLFLRKYDRYRKTQAEAIVATQNTLVKKMAILEEARKEKEELLISLQGQKSVLSSELRDKESLLSTLKKDEGRLRKELRKKQKAHEALNQAIEGVIQAEIQKKVQAARRPATKPSGPKPKPGSPVEKPVRSSANAGKTSSIPEDGLTLAFKQDRGRLPWPVDNGFISRGFGRQKHPTLHNIEITNNGIDIQTDASSAVRAIHKGKVAGVQFIPGHEYTVILQHGDYYTVYSNLSETRLKKGANVAKKQVIGRVSNNPITGVSALHFELWHQKKRLNPARWIKK